ncbi:MAG: PKD domain-containing protein [bacterium]|nr:PKD domain-containing protein [bacterium]
MNFKLFSLTLIVFALSFSLASAYERDVHVFLTDETINFYNDNFPDKKISVYLKNFILDGAYREDDFPRYLNHFYDPVLDRGLTYDSRIDRNMVKHYTWSLVGGWQKSKDWALDGKNQNQPLYKTSTALASVLTAAQQQNIGTLTTETDFTWQKAINFYAKGENEKAMFVLGHILHLVEDLSVPEHTRNDHHPDDSPYENYTSQFNLNNPDNSLTGRLNNKQPIILGDLNNYFNELATYTNSHFYSKDTINIIYDNPKIDGAEDFTIIGGFYYVLNQDNREDYFLATKKSLKKSLVTTSGDINIDNDLIMKDYWQRLSTKAVQYSAGAINLFFEEAEKAKQEYELNNKQQSDSLKASFIDVLRERAFNVVHAWNQATQLAVSDAAPTIYRLPTAEEIILSIARVSPESPIIENLENTEEINTQINQGESASFQNQISEAASQITAIRGTIDLLSAVRESNSRIESIAQSFGNNQNSISVSGGGVSSRNNVVVVIEEEIIATSSVVATSTPEPEPEPEPAPQLVPAIPNQAPTARFSFAPTNSALGDTIEFSAVSSTDSDGQIISYFWNFGDGEILNATSSLISHNYVATGTFAVILTTTDDDNATSTATANIIIAAPRVPIANHIVISEILFDPVGNDNQANEEFVELYNPTNVSVDLDNWRFRMIRNSGNDTALGGRFGNNQDQTIIPAHGFLLVGFNSYDEAEFNGREADIRRTSTDLRNGRLNNGNLETIKILLWDEDDNEIDKMFYDAESITAEGQGLERRAWQSGYCVSGQDEGEFLGQGCDRDNEIDWQIRTTPNPQNSSNLPEPRRTPIDIGNFNVVYEVFPRPKLILNWDWSLDYNNATNTLSYQVRELNYGSSTPLNSDLTATSTSYFIDEVGRNYQFVIRAVDVEGLMSATATAQVAVPSFATGINFFRNPAVANLALVELYYDNYPFIPKWHGYHQNAWNEMVFYKNKEAPKIANLSHSWSGYATGTIAFDYQACGISQSGAGVILPELRDHCSYDYGSPRRSAMNWDRYLSEDDHLLLEANSSNPLFQVGDYVTIAFYSYDGDNGQALIAVDKNHYVFTEETPNHQLPIFREGSLGFSFDSQISKLVVSWPTADDADTLGAFYELRIASSSETLAAAQPIDITTTTHSFYAAAGRDYHFSIKARDDFNNYSAATLSGAWSYPIEEVVLIQGDSDNWSDGWGGVPGNCNYNMDNCFDSRSLQSLLFASDTIFRAANVVLNHHNGNDEAAIILDVMADASNLPDFNSVLASARINSFNRPTSTEVTFVFPDFVNLVGGQRYWLGLRVAEYGGDGPSRFHFNGFSNDLRTSGGGGIVDGNAAYRSANNGASYVSQMTGSDWFLKLFK